MRKRDWAAHCSTTRCSPGSVLKPPRFPPLLSVAATDDEVTCLGLVVVSPTGSNSPCCESRHGVCVCVCDELPDLLVVLRVPAASGQGSHDATIRNACSNASGS